MIFKILALILFIGVIFDIIDFMDAIFMMFYGSVAFLVLSGILNFIKEEILKKRIEHEVESLKKIANKIYDIYNHSIFSSILFEIENEYYLTFYNDKFIETNKINENYITIVNSSKYNYNRYNINNYEINFTININNLKNNKKIKKFYKDEIIELYFNSYYNNNSTPDFILKKWEAFIPKKDKSNIYNKTSNSTEVDIKKEKNYIERNQNNNLDKIKVIFFDTETNGLSALSSVLSISAAKCLVDYQNKTVEIIERYERFYYPVEKYNSEAISVNGLSQSVITQKRKGVKYEKYFKEDQKSFNEFTKGIEHFVAHNIEFDRKFLNMSLKRQFCTMKSNTNIIKLKMVYGKHKWPKLEEAVKFYHVQSDNSKFHDSMYDVEMTIKVFEKMLNLNKTNKYIYDFLYKPMYHYINYDNIS